MEKEETPGRGAQVPKGFSENITVSFDFHLFW